MNEIKDQVKLNLEMIDIEYLKQELLKKSEVLITSNNNDDTFTYEFEYNEEIKGNKVRLFLKVVLLNKELESLTLSTMDEDISKEDLEYYYNKEILNMFMRNNTKGIKEKYTVRCYFYLKHDVGFKGEYIISWKNKVRFKPLLNEKRKNYIVDRIVAVDVEVEAITLTQARSMAYNLAKEFVAYLGVLMNVGFYEYVSGFSHFIRKVVSEEKVEFLHELQRKAFYDEELDLIVIDNLNGLHHRIDYTSEQASTYTSIHKQNVINHSIESSFIQNMEEENCKELKRTFKNLKITKNKKCSPAEYREDIEYQAEYSLDLRVPKSIRKYFKAIQLLEENDPDTYCCFRNCCRLYNISQTCGATEPTLMLSYMVSAIEALAKSQMAERSNKKGKEKMGFSEFAQKYLHEEYDKEFCDFLYGNIRSGHFHSGEMYFGEYELSLDITFNPYMAKMVDLYNRGMNILRKVIINWIYEELLITPEEKVVRKERIRMIEKLTKKDMSIEDISDVMGIDKLEIEKICKNIKYSDKE